jgi:hypothetical protein
VDLVSAPRANSANARENVKRGFGRNLRASPPAEDATQGLVDVEALDQGAGGGNAQDRLGHESSGEGATVLGRPARPPGRLGNEDFEADHVEGGDETAQRFGDRIVVLARPREQKTWMYLQRAFIASRGSSVISTAKAEANRFLR